MFIRQCCRKRNGQRHAYWALVESYRTATGPRQRASPCSCGAIRHSLPGCRAADSQRCRDPHPLLLHPVRPPANSPPQTALENNLKKVYWKLLLQKHYFFLIQLGQSGSYSLADPGRRWIYNTCTAPRFLPKKRLRESVASREAPSSSVPLTPPLPQHAVPAGRPASASSADRCLHSAWQVHP